MNEAGSHHPDHKTVRNIARVLGQGELSDDARSILETGATEEIIFSGAASSHAEAGEVLEQMKKEEADRGEA